MVDKDAHYLMCKGGVFYFTRHVPNDLQRHYQRPRIVMCLKTRSKIAALKASHSLASKLDEFWLQMRLSSMEVPGANMLVKKQTKESFTSSALKLSDALEMYCTLKGGNRSATFFAAARRNVGYVIEHLGDRPLDTYLSSDASAFRDWLISRDLNLTSVKRIFGTVRAVVTLAISESGLNCINAFSKTFLPTHEKQKRATIDLANIRKVQQVCFQMGDDRRLLVALISDTGLRLSEALGLCWDDVHLDHEYPHIALKEHPWRPLKTTSSKRLLPLVGCALEAVKLLHKHRSTPFLFNSYTNAKQCNGNSCSAALNKWLKQYVPDAVMHSFRHTFRDRLRNAGVQSEVIDQLGGWSKQSVGQGYGDGYSLRNLYQETRKITYLID
jgi:integrase